MPKSVENFSEALVSWVCMVVAVGGSLSLLFAALGSVFGWNFNLTSLGLM